MPTSQVFLTPDYLGIAMEYAAGGDMYNLVTLASGLSERDARWFFQQLIIAVDFCHRAVSARVDAPQPAPCSGQDCHNFAISRIIG
jgi:serine/threonine protein kinase